ncbi:MAG: EcsC family protein [Firmicutes bacterium]|nr:EcsC family protein [Bacillota bacterium]MBQ6012864.1 EcsC family protein [Bacillota bacterium]MBQ6260031.1 EcsC family protein [Bacillota bacterium]MBR0114711.1 EcsC family protein [Bacillota bacterium]
MQQEITKENLRKVMDACYEKAINGIPLVSKPVDDLALEYLDRYPTKEEAVKKLIDTQVVKCTTAGFVAGLGGAIALPVAVPANLSSVLYVQLRMIAAVAYVGGYDVTSDKVQTLIYACLVGISVNELLKRAGIVAGEKIAVNVIKKIPGAFFVKINKLIGFRLVTKFGTKGVINLAKLVPGIGGFINGGFDLVQTKIIGARAYKWFYDGIMEGEKNSDVDDSLEIFDIESDENDLPIEE